MTDEPTVKPHAYRAWVDENDVGNTCCLARRTALTVHLPPVEMTAVVAHYNARLECPFCTWFAGANRSTATEAEAAVYASYEVHRDECPGPF